MRKFVKHRSLQIIGGIGTLICVVIFVLQPSFPTPDKLLVFMTLVAMMFGKAKELLKRFVPFVALLLVYESFRGLVPYLNTRVNFLWMPDVDRLMFFGKLPTAVLQNWLWHGQVQWYDFVFYGAYTLHFVLPFALAVLIWQTKSKLYWQYVTTFLAVSFMAFITFLLFPAAPPWMAHDMNLIEPITRVSSAVWAAFGIHDFPSVYNKISPNPVAAVPSLHAAYAFLFAFYLTKYYKTNWKWASWAYPVLIWVGTVYQGEHYVVDVIIAVIYASLAFYVAPYVVSGLQTIYKRVKLTLH